MKPCKWLLGIAVAEWAGQPKIADSVIMNKVRNAPVVLPTFLSLSGYFD